MASDNPVISTPFGEVSQVTTGAGQTKVHTVANWMWLPMILMGVMAVAAAVGLGIAQAQVASDLGEEFSPLRELESRWPALLSRMITRRLPLRDFAAAFERSPGHVKSIVEIA